MPIKARRLSDFATARTNLYSSFLEAASGIKPYETDTHVLELGEIGYDSSDDEERNPDKYNFSAQTQAIHGKKTLGRRLRGTWSIRNKQTGEVEKQQRQLLAIVPRVNEDGTMIYRGSRYAMVNQHRIKPAAFARRKKNDEMESFVNVQPGTGSNHRYVMNPETGVFSLQIGHSRLPLAGVLKTLGVGEEQIREAWGDELAKVNLAKRDPKALSKLYDKMVRSSKREADAPDDLKRVQIQEAFAGMRVDPWSMQRTVGRETDRVDGETILAATKRVLAMANDAQEGDDRDHLAFQTFHGVEDSIAERVRLDKDNWQRKHLRLAMRTGNLNRIPSKLLQKQIQSAIFGSGLGVQPDYANPLDALDRATRITKKGEGGLSDAHSTPTESRDVHASQHFFIDPARTTESLSIGVDVNATMDAERGEDGKLYIPMKDARTGEIRRVNSEDVMDATVAVGRVGQDVDGLIGAIRNGKETFVRPEEVDFIADKPGTQIYSDLGNLVPFRSAMAPHRLAMGSRFLAQSLPLVNPEAPLVQAADGNGGSLYKTHGRTVGAVESQYAGTVKSVEGDRIVLDTAEGKRTVNLHKLQPLGGKTGLYNTPMVKVGDTVKPGQLLAKSNYTDDEGTLAIGVNARIAFMPWGDNYEDAFVVSQSFADRMTSDHLYRSRYDHEAANKVSKNDFLSAMPSEYDKRQLSTLDDDGVVKIGTRVKEGDPLILAAQPKSGGKGRVHKKGGSSFRNRSMTWDHHSEGEVADVFVDRKGNKVVSVKAAMPLTSADKISSLFGDKGVVHVVPDAQMPIGEDGQAVEVVASDLGLISRENPGRAHTAFLGKIARKTGKPYVVEEFPEEDFDEWVKSELDKNNVSKTETLVDPRNGRKIEGVGTGELYMLKLHHISESKSHARGIGKYSADGTASKGSEEGAQAKRLSNQELGALMSHGAYEFLRESALVRGQRNDEYWARYVNGHEPEQPKVPFVYEKFIGYLKGMGINPVSEGTKTKVLLLSDKDTKKLGNKAIKSGETLDFYKDQKPIAGGLMDPAIFGDGSKFARFELPEKIPHPMMEDAMRNILGVTQKSYRAILAGQEELGEYGSGPKAIEKYLGDLDLAKEIQAERKIVRTGRKTKRDAAVKRLRYLKGLASREIEPASLMVQQVPIIPPNMRPISVLENTGTPMVDGMNLLYRDMIAAADSLKSVGEFSSDTSNERLAVYDTVKAAYGLGQPMDPELRAKQVTGLMKKITGSSPKHCYDDKTEILTQNGWKLFDDLTEFDVVATLSQNTGELEFQKPTAIHKFPYVGPLFHFQTPNKMDLMVTPNHRMWVRERTGNQPADLSTGWKFEEAFITASRYFRSGGRIWMRNAPDGWGGRVDRPEFLPDGVSMELFAEFVGFWVAEGWLAGDRQSVQIAQSESNEEIVGWLRELLPALGFSFKETFKPCKNVTRAKKDRQVTKQNTSAFVRGDAYHWTIKSPELAAWLSEHVGLLADQKSLSRELLDWPSELLRLFLLGACKGDASKQEHNPERKKNPKHSNRSDVLIGYVRLQTTSKQLAENYQEMLIKCGLGSTVKEVETPAIKSRKYRPIWAATINSSRFTVLEPASGNAGTVDFVDYAGYVHCVTVPNGVVLVRRGNYPVFSGNSFVQRKLLSGTVDAVGRGVALPNAKLTMDEVGLPEEQAWTMYKMPVVREMRRRGVPLSKAMEEITNRSAEARRILLDQMEKRPVVVSRAPVLHKFGIMAFRPKLIQGDSIHMNPLIHGGLGLDHDGDEQIGTVVVAVPNSLEKLSFECKKALVTMKSRWDGVSNYTDTTQETSMSSITRASLPILSDHQLHCLDLSEFPHYESSEKTTSGQFGDIHWHRVPEGVKVLAVDPATGEPTWSTVEWWTEHHGCPVEIVTLSNGYQIFTDDDPRAVLGVKHKESLTLSRATPTEAEAVGMMVPRLASFEVDELDVYTVFDASGYNRSYSAGAYRVQDSVDLDFDFGWLLSAFCSDGWNEGGEKLCLAKSNQAVQAAWRSRLRDIAPTSDLYFGERSRSKSQATESGQAYGGTFASILSSRLFANLFSDLCGKGALNKQLPTWYLVTPQVFREGLLCGFIDTDGTVTSTKAKAKKSAQLRASITSTSLLLLRQIKLLSHSLGIQSKIAFSKTTDAGNPAWILTWRLGEIQDFILKHKKQLADKSQVDTAATVKVDRDSSAYVRLDKIPLPVELAREIRRSIKMPSDRSKVTPRRSKTYNALSDAVRRGHCSRNSMKYLFDFVDREWVSAQVDGPEFLAILDNTSVTWEFVEGVEKTGQVEVGYDLTVPGAENWMTAEGIFLSNTLNFHAVVGDKAAAEAREKMLPSKALVSPRDFKSPVHKPGQDHALGLYLASTQANDKVRPQSFRSRADVRKAMSRGEIRADTPVIILEDD